MAIRTVANQIQTGEIDCGLAVGVESMSQGPSPKLNIAPEVESASQEASDCKYPMGWTSENVAGELRLMKGSTSPEKAVADDFATARRLQHLEGEDGRVGG